MLTLRKSAHRGHLDHGWLDTYHSFSFGHYLDREHRGFRSLRVINEDFIAPGQGFGTHGHADMEIITYVISGQIAHKDSMGSVSTLGPGDVQVMTAGSGIEHSEYNPSPTETTHLLQIWIRPREEGATPRYEERAFPAESKKSGLNAIASGDGVTGALEIGQDATVYASILCAGESISHQLDEGRGAWIQVVSGKLELDGEALESGDGAAVENQGDFHINALEDVEFLVFDLK